MIVNLMMMLYVDWCLWLYMLRHNKVTVYCNVYIERYSIFNVWIHIPPYVSSYACENLRTYATYAYVSMHPCVSVCMHVRVRGTACMYAQGLFQEFSLHAKDAKSIDARRVNIGNEGRLKSP